MQKKKRGGKRKGAGRPKTKEDTKVMRVPLSKVDVVNKLYKEMKKTEPFDKQKNHLTEVSIILDEMMELFENNTRVWTDWKYDFKAKAESIGQHLYDAQVKIDSYKKAVDFLQDIYPEIQRPIRIDIVNLLDEIHDKTT